MKITIKKLPRVKKDEPLILKKWIQDLILSVCEGFLNLKIVQPISDGYRVVSVEEARIIPAETGQWIVVMPTLVNNQKNTVFMKACLEDGTECFVEVPVVRVFRNRATTPGTPPTIDPGNVPDGESELI